MSETVGVRCRERLLRIRERLGLLKPPVIVSLTGRAAPTLTYPLLGVQSHADEMLIVSINDFSGNVIAIVRALGKLLISFRKCFLMSIEYKFYALGHFNK